MTCLRRRRNILVQLVAFMFVLVIWASGSYASSPPRRLSHAGLRSAFSLKERFQRAFSLDSDVLHSRQKRFIYFRFKLPFGSNLEIKWAFNWVVPSEVKYLTRLQVALPITRPLPTYLVDDQYQPPFATLFGTKSREDKLESDDYYYDDENSENESDHDEIETDAFDHEQEKGGSEAGDQESKLKEQKNRTKFSGNQKEVAENRPKEQQKRMPNRSNEVDEPPTKSRPLKNATENLDGKVEFQGPKSKTQKRAVEHQEYRVIKLDAKSENNTETSSNEDNEFIVSTSGEIATEGGNGAVRRIRSLHVTDRIDAYEALEDILEEQGLPAHACLQRTICEVAEAPLHYGIVGDFLNLLLTPSVASLSAGSGDLSALSDYLEAEVAGRERGECDRHFAACPSSVFDMVPLIRHTILDFGSF